MAEKLFSRRRLTMVGEIRGQERQKLAGIDYPYDFIASQGAALLATGGRKASPSHILLPLGDDSSNRWTVRIISKGKLLTSFF